MSFASRMLIKLLQVSGMKGKLARGSQKTFEEAVSYNRKHPFVMPKDHKAIYEQINIRTGFGVYPCLKISQSDSCRDRAVLFTWGGGGLLNAWKSQLGMAVKLERDAKVPVYYPIYPLATEHSLLGSMHFRFIRSAGNRERLTAIFWLISEDRYDWKKRHHPVACSVLPCRRVYRSGNRNADSVSLRRYEHGTQLDFDSGNDRARPLRTY